MATTTNPFAVKTTVPSGGILASAMNNVTGVDTSKNVAKVDQTALAPDGKTTGQVQSTGYTAAPTASTGYTAIGAQTEDWKVNPDQTVAGLVAKYTDPSSQAMQRAQSVALQQANGLGLKSSSIAAGAGTAAMLDRALQMATPDAATYADAGKFNAGAKNTASLADQQAANTASQFGAAAANNAAAADAQALNTARQFEAGAKNTASSQNAQASNQLQSQQLGLLANAMGQNAQAQNAAAEASAGRAQQAALANQSQQFQGAMAQYDAALKASLQDADAATKVQLSQMDADTKTTLAGIEAEFKTQMQASQSSAAMYSETIKSIGTIMTDKDMDATAKQNAINQQMSALRNSLALQAAITEIPGLADLIGGVSAGVGGNNSAPVPAPATVPPRVPVGSGGASGEAP